MCHLLIALVLCVPVQEQKEKKIYTREEFKKLVYGKTQEEVKKELGTADRTGFRNIGIERFAVWEYDAIVKDKDAKELDEITLVWFNGTVDGKVTVGRVSMAKKKR